MRITAVGHHWDLVILTSARIGIPGPWRFPQSFWMIPSSLLGAEITANPHITRPLTNQSNCAGELVEVKVIGYDRDPGPDGLTTRPWWISTWFCFVSFQFPPIHGDYLKSSGLGKAVMYLHKNPKELRENKWFTNKLIRKYEKLLLFPKTGHRNKNG
jgi:hypothetical protein